MSLVEPALCLEELGHASQGSDLSQTYREVTPRQDPEFLRQNEHDTYRGPFHRRIYNMSVHEAMMAPEPLKMQKTLEAPALPEKSLRRPSRMLDGLVDLKPSGELPTVEHLAQAAPHETYLSSEEDASSSADDFSDFDYDSGSEGSLSPDGSRKSHEDTARMVSVVFYGKPSVVEVSLGRRSASINSIGEARRARQSSRSATISSTSSSLSGGRPSTASTASTTPASIHTQSPGRKQSPQPQLQRSSTAVFPSMGARSRRPLFLSIDPYANGSTYSLDQVSKKSSEETERPRTPKTPAAMLKNGMDKTIRLVRKRSAPMLNATGPPPTSSVRDLQQLASLTALPSSRPDLSLVMPGQEGRHEAPAETPGTSSPQQPVTFSDIMRNARKNARQSLRPQTPTPAAPAAESPVAAAPPSTRRSLLGGLAARRRSLKTQSRMQ